MRLGDDALHALGASKFTDDPVPPADCLYLQPVLSTVAHGIIEQLDVSAAQDLAGVVRIFTAKDIPGSNQVGNVAADEVLLADKEVVYHGQPLALIAAESADIARQAADLVQVGYRALPAVFDAREADRLGLHIAPKRVFGCGDLDAAWPKCALVVKGTAASGAQEHMYLETQTAMAYPTENHGLKVISATQSPGMTQRIIARVLGLAMHQIEVDVLRLGGGFGGKEEQATPFAAMAALAAFKCQRPAKLTLRRGEDCIITGKRHPYVANFELGLDASGKILAYKVDFFQNAGAYADLSLAILERTLFHAGNSYYIPNMQVGAVSCRTHLPPNTAFRGFGGPQAMFVLESAIFEAARTMGVEASEIQRRNLLQAGQSFYYGMPVQHCQAESSWVQAESDFDWERRQQAITTFNAEHPLQKKAIAMMPVCFGISFTATFLNQADALVHVYADGSVSVSCGAVEMGQGVKTKIAKLTASTLGVAEHRVKIESTNTTRIANMSPTAASTGTDLNGQAVRIACLEIKRRLLKVAAGLLENTEIGDLDIVDERVYCLDKPTDIHWRKLITQAYLSRTALSAQAHYATPDVFFDRSVNKGHPFAYHVYGCASVEVTVDCLRGRYSIDRVAIVHDDGQPLDVKVDLGQIEGAVVQGLGWMTLEQVIYDADGRLLTDSLSAYKVPDLHFAPDIEVRFLDSADNPPGLLHSKAVGEPPLMYGIAAYFALVKAIQAFNPNWQADYHAPMTPERVLLALYAHQEPHA
ncbi:MAG: molybdopterin-dependent oxidoreductase [Methylomonas sp.]|nr:molybdopterin-dependent oxidoreductase [Methylomonas sp.]